MTNEYQIGGTTWAEDSNGNIVISVDNATINGNTALRNTSEASASPGFGNWTQVNSSRPSIVITQYFIETDGTTRGRITLEVDKSGGTTADYGFNSGIDPEAGSGAAIRETQTAYLPAGAQYRIFNDNDPNNANVIGDVREVTL